jgi:hypothetical protein
VAVGDGWGLSGEASEGTSSGDIDMTVSVIVDPISNSSSDDSSEAGAVVPAAKGGECGEKCGEKCGDAAAADMMGDEGTEACRGIWGRSFKAALMEGPACSAGVCNRGIRAAGRGDSRGKACSRGRHMGNKNARRS